MLIFAYGIGLPLLAALTFMELGRPIERGGLRAALAGRIIVLGIDTVELRANEREVLPVDGGLKVTKVYAASPADSAGILVGDVLVSIKGFETRSSSGLSAVLRKCAGQEVEVSVIRSGTPRKLTAKLNR